jgi:hypothetical protein
VRQVKSRSTLECEWFTKISANENGFNIEEAKKIRQTLENMRRKDESLLDVMYRQAARVTRQKLFTDTRQIWISYLPMQGEDQPEKGWIECTGQDPLTKKPAPKGCTGQWKAVVKNWVPFRKEAAKLYYSGVIPNLLPGKPIQWGGDMDYWRGAGRNFCPLNVGGPRYNTFWGDPRDIENIGACLPVDESKVKSSKVLMANVASGRAKRQHMIPKLLLEDSLVPTLNTEAKNDPPSVD